jgi:hypothetical protein
VSSPVSPAPSLPSLPFSSLSLSCVPRSHLFPNIPRSRTLHLSQAWPVRLEAPFLRAVAAIEALGSYSMCRSCRECFGGMGGPASSSTGRFTGMAGLESRCDGDWRRQRRRRRNKVQVGSQSSELLAWAGLLGLATSVSPALAGKAGEGGATICGVSVGGWHGWWVRRGGGWEIETCLLGARRKQV